MGKMITVRSGVAIINAPTSPLVRSILFKLPLAGIVAIALHPTVVSVFGERISHPFGALALAVLLPTLRIIVIAPFFAILAVSALMAVYLRSPETILVGFAAYAFFFLMAYRSRLFLQIFLAIGAVATTISIAQFLFPDTILNAHATAESLHNILNKYRPTSIFPAQVYYNQALLLAVPVILLAAERRGLVAGLLGAAGAISGSTAGVLLVVLMLPFKRGYFAVVGFAAALAVIALISFDAVAYNYSLWDFLNSFATRLGENRNTAFGQVSISAGPSPVATVAAPGADGVAPNLSLLVEFIAFGGVLLALMLTLTLERHWQLMLQLGAAVVALLLTQVLHPTMGTLFFAPFLGALAALEWRMLLWRRQPVTNNLLRRLAAPDEPAPQRE